jgi:hypothetical protein
VRERLSRKPNLVLSHVENLQESQMKVDYERNLLQKEQRIASLESQLIASRKQNDANAVRIIDGDRV